MTEKERIQQLVNGERPSGEYDILRISNINDASDALENFKKSISTLLENNNLRSDDPMWNDLLPEKIVRIVNRMDKEDYKNDELVFSVKSMVDDVLDPDIKTWQWYSSQLNENGFEVYFEGTFRARFTGFVRFQGIPLSKITIERKGVVYPINVYKDVMTYKKFD